MALRRLVLTLNILFILISAANAQKGVLKGIIYEQGTPSRVGEVTVRNLTQNIQVKTNYMGEFSISARPGDTLYLTKDNYADYRLPIKSNKDVVIQLIKSRRLAEVVITAPTKKEELDEVMEGYRKRGTFYNGKPPVLAYIFKPLTAIYELVGRTPRQARRFANYYETELEQSEIDRRFNKGLVKNLTNLSDPDLTNFMDMYRPTFDKLSKWNQYDLMNYVAASLKDFDAKGRPVAEKLPDLREFKLP